MLSQTAIRTTIDDLPGYYLEGHAALLEALRAAPPDLRAMRFLNDAPPPREFWARRQAHETTVHAVDALAAKLGRWPRADETDVEPRSRIDGLDELLRGFFTQRSVQAVRRRGVRRSRSSRPTPTSAGCSTSPSA